MDAYQQKSEQHEPDPQDPAQQDPVRQVPDAVAQSLRSPRGAFACLAAVQMSLVAAISLLSMALPEMQREFEISPSELAWAMASYGLAFSGLLIVGGRTADAVGPRRTFLAGGIAFGGAAVAGALVPSFGALIGARMAQGAAAAFVAPAALVLAESLFPDEVRRTRILAVWGGVSGAGAVIGMLLSGVIVAGLAWRWVFAPPALVIAIALAVVAKGLSGKPPDARARPAGATSLLLTAGLSILTYGLLSIANEPGTTKGLAFASLGLLALIAFAVVDRRAPLPLIPISFFASSTRRLAILAILAASGASASVSFFLTLYFRQVREYGALEASLHFLPFLLIIAVSAASGNLVRRYGPYRVAALGCGCAALALCSFARLVGGPGSIGMLVGFALFPVGLGLVFSGATVSAMTGVITGQRGLGGGVVNTAMEVGPAIGLALLVTLAELRADALARAGLLWSEATTGGYALAFLVCAGAFAMLGAGFVAVAKRRLVESRTQDQFKIK